MMDPNNPCLFCNTNNKEYLIENDLAFATFDSYPVSKNHLLDINREHLIDKICIQEVMPPDD